MRKTILGLDIGGSYATAFLLDFVPENPKQFVQSSDFVPFQVPYSKSGIESLKTLEFDLAVLEPTGHYETVICQHFERSNKPYRQVNLNRLSAFRKNNGLPKSDGLDAFTLALYGHQKYDDPSAWVKPINLKDFRLQLQHRDQLQKNRRSQINRLRQKLAQEFPEMAQTTSINRKWGQPSPGLIRWLAGAEFRQAKSYQNKLNESIGLGPSGFTCSLAQTLLAIDEEAIAIETEVGVFIAEKRFESYLRVFERCGFSTALSAWILARIYPFEKYLDGDRPYTYQRTTKRGKIVTQNLSLSQFKASLGSGTIPNTSGIRGETKTRYWRGRGGDGREPEYFPVGDAYCRKSFFLWCRNMISTGKLDCELAPKFLEYWERKRKHQNFYQATGNTYGYVLKTLFFELLKETKNYATQEKARNEREFPIQSQSRETRSTEPIFPEF